MATSAFGARGAQTVSKAAPAAKPAKAAGSKSLELKASVPVFCTLAYPSLTEPDEQSGKFSVLAILDPAEPTTEDILTLVRAHSIELTGEEELPAGYHNPVRSGDEINPATRKLVFAHAAFRDKLVVRLKSAYQPKAYFGPQETPCDVSQIRGGDQCVVEISAYGYNNQSRGVALSLGAIWQIAPGAVKIEKGASSGASFSKVDKSRFTFGKFPQSASQDFDAE
jgi:hypothetical protein